MSEIKNVGYTWMALTKCNHLMPLHFKGLNVYFHSVQLCKVVWNVTYLSTVAITIFVLL